MKTFARLLAIFAPLVAGSAHAGEDFFSDRFFMTPNVSTLGAGVEAGYRWNENWQVRGGVNGLSTSYVYHDRNSDFNSKLTLLNGGATIDYFPFAENFYLSGGMRLSANKIEGKVKNIETRLKGGGTVLIPDPMTDFTVRQNAIQPYIGTGYSYQIKERISLNLDFGALYAGTPDLNVDSNANQLGFTRRQINNEIERARNRLAPFRFYPVVQVGLKVQF